MNALPGVGAPGNAAAAAQAPPPVASRPRPAVSCQVPGCTVDLSSSRLFHQVGGKGGLLPAGAPPPSPLALAPQLPLVADPAALLVHRRLLCQRLLPGLGSVFWLRHGLAAAGLAATWARGDAPVPPRQLVRDRRPEDHAARPAHPPPGGKRFARPPAASGNSLPARCERLWPPPSPALPLQRYHVCPDHCTAPQVVMNGIVQRFCQQVGCGAQGAGLLKPERRAGWVVRAPHAASPPSGAMRRASWALRLPSSHCSAASSMTSSALPQACAAAGHSWRGT